MEQVIIGGTPNLLHTTDTERNVVAGSSNWYPDEYMVAQCIPTPGKLKNLRVEINDVPGTGTYTFTLRRAVGIGAWANTALTCTIGAAATKADDMVNEIAVATGDVVCLECDPDAPDNARRAKWTMMFEGDNEKESILLFTGQCAQTTDFTHFAVMGSRTGNETIVRSVCPTGGTMKNLYVWLSEDPGADPDAYKFTFRIGGVSQTLTCTIVANNRTGNDEAHPIGVVAGNLLTLQEERIATPTASPYAACGMTFVADTDGESLILGGVEDPISNTLTQFSRLVGDTFFGGNEFEAYQLAQICTLKKLYIALSGAPGGTDKYTFTVRQNDASPALGLVVEIAGAATTGNDITHTITIGNDDELTLMSVPTDTPTARSGWWGLVGSIAAAPTGIENKSANMGSKMVGAGLI